MTFLGTEQYAVVLPWLFEIGMCFVWLSLVRIHVLNVYLSAFSDIDAFLEKMVYTQLMWLGSAIRAQSSGLCFSSVLAALTRLGASRDVLASHGWTNVPDTVTASGKSSRRGSPGVIPLYPE